MCLLSWVVFVIGQRIFLDFENLEKVIHMRSDSQNYVKVGFDSVPMTDLEDSQIQIVCVLKFIIVIHHVRLFWE